MSPHKSIRFSVNATLVWSRKFGVFALTFLFALQILLPPDASAQNRRGASLPLIRDAEIETLMRAYTTRLFRAAGLTPGAVRVYLINARSINAFVAGGQRIFIHTGLLTRADTPNEVIGVLAHETAHIAGAHLARRGIEVDRLSNLTIISALLGAAAVGAAAAGGASGVGTGATGVLAGAGSLSQSRLLAYSRAVEASADQAALRYLDATGMSGRGMLELFTKLANESRARLNNIPPYVLSHPLARNRIATLEKAVKRSPHYHKRDSAQLMLRHRLMQAKLHGFLGSPRTVNSIYGRNPTSLEGRYARSIVLYRRGEMANALPIMDSLIREIPKNPYFHELKGQALLESGNPRAAVAPLRRAVQLLPDNGLVRIITAEALIATGDGQVVKEALDHLVVAARTENDQPRLHDLRARAYAAQNQIAFAELSTAEAAFLRGDRELAIARANGAIRRGLQKGTPKYLRAQDIIRFAKQERRR